MDGQEYGPTALDMAELALEEVTHAGRCVLAGRAVHPDLPDEPVNVAGIRTLLDGRSTPEAVREALWRALSARQHDDDWLAVAVGVAVPMLRRISTRLAAEDSDLRLDLDGEVLTGFLTALRGLPEDTPGLAVRLAWAAFRSGLAYAFVHSADLPAGQTVVPVCQAVPASPWGPGLRHLLAEARRTGVLSGAQAELVRLVRIGRVAPAVLAVRTSAPGEEWALRLSIAEGCLLRAVLSGRLAVTAGR